MAGYGLGGFWSHGGFGTEFRAQYEVLVKDDYNHLRRRVGRTFEGAAENFQARIADPNGQLDLSDTINITNLFALPGDEIRPAGSATPFTLDLTTRLVENAFELTVPAETLPSGNDSHEPLANLVDSDPIKVPRRIEYIFNGDQLNQLPDNITEFTVIIEDADGKSGNGFQDGNGFTIIEEEDIPAALNNIEFILDNNLLANSPSNEENTPSQDIGIIDRVRVSRFIDDDETTSSEFDVKSLAPLAPLAPIGIKALAPLAPIAIKSLEFEDAPESQIISKEIEINFQNNIPVNAAGPTGREPTIIQAEDLHLNNYQVETLKKGDKIISLPDPSANTGTATLNVDDFSIAPGRYDLGLSVFDENDGESELKVFVNDHLIEEPILLNQGISSPIPSETSRREIVLEGIHINSSDIITIQGTANQWEFASIDSLSFTPDL